MSEVNTFYDLMCALEKAHPSAPEIGKASSPSQEPYRFGVFPSLSFSTTDISKPDPSLLKKRADDDKPTYYLNHFGLLGPNGALPIHLTEYALQRIRHHDDHAWVEFLNLFHHRFFTLFYRACVDGWPIANQYKGRNPFFLRLSNLLGDSKLDIAPYQHQQRKHQEGLERALSHSLRMPVRLSCFEGQWLLISKKNRCQLGSSRAVLGRSAMIGNRVWDLHSKVHIELGPMRWKQFETLLPRQQGLAHFIDRVNRLLGAEYDWDYSCLVQQAELPEPLVNGRQQLGRNLWLGKNQRAKYVRVRRQGCFIHT